MLKIILLKYIYITLTNFFYFFRLINTTEINNFFFKKKSFTNLVNTLKIYTIKFIIMIRINIFL